MMIRCFQHWMQQEGDKCATNCVWASTFTSCRRLACQSHLSSVGQTSLDYRLLFFVVISTCLRFIALGGQTFVHNSIDFDWQEQKKSFWVLSETAKVISLDGSQKPQLGQAQCEDEEWKGGCMGMWWWHGDNVTWEMEESRWVHWAARRGSMGARKTRRPWCPRHWFWALMMWDTGSLLRTFPIFIMIIIIARSRHLITTRKIKDEWLTDKSDQSTHRRQEKEGAARWNTCWYSLSLKCCR